MGVNEHARSADDELLRRHGITVGTGVDCWYVCKNGNPYYLAGWGTCPATWPTEAEARTFAIEQASKLEAEADR